jgi:hypothetical protein
MNAWARRCALGVIWRIPIQRRNFKMKQRTRSYVVFLGFALLGREPAMAAEDPCCAHHGVVCDSNGTVIKELSGDQWRYCPPYPPPSAPTHQVRPNEFARSDCNEDLPGSLYTTGKIRYYCRHTSWGHVQLSTGNVGSFKLEAIACGRGPDDMMAKHNANARADEKVFELQIKKADEAGADRSKNEMFIQDQSEDRCSQDVTDLN